MNKSAGVFVTLMSASLAAPVQATPVFLACQMTQPEGDIFRADVQMNEDAGTVTYSFLDNGRTFTVRGFFTPAEVSFGRFTISRTDLTFKRNNDGLLRTKSGDPPSLGKCVINRAARAF